VARQADLSTETAGVPGRRVPPLVPSFPQVIHIVSCDVTMCHNFPFNDRRSCPIRGDGRHICMLSFIWTGVGAMKTRVCRVLVVSLLGVAILSAANAQTAVPPSARTANDLQPERKVRVVLPSPYERTDTGLEAIKTIQPASSTMPLAAEPATGAGGGPDAQALTALTFSQPVQASKLTAPAAPQSHAPLVSPLRISRDDRKIGKAASTI
jgi:hypothetical protein